jgi:hypothetical protein
LKISNLVLSVHVKLRETWDVTNNEEFILAYEVPFQFVFIVTGEGRTKANNFRSIMFSRNVLFTLNLLFLYMYIMNFWNLRVVFTPNVTKQNFNILSFLAFRPLPGIITYSLLNAKIRAFACEPSETLIKINIIVWTGFFSAFVFYEYPLI